MGSGTTGRAAKIMGYDFLGFEINPEYCEIANDWINDPAQEALPLSVAERT